MTKCYRVQPAVNILSFAVFLRASVREVVTMPASELSSTRCQVELSDMPVTCFAINTRTAKVKTALPIS